MALSATSIATLDGKWEPLSYKLDEWLVCKDELDKKHINDPPLKLSKQEIAEQALHDIEYLGRNISDDWLDEFPLFEELQTLTPAEETDIKSEEYSGHELRFEEERFSPNDGLVVPEIHKQPVTQDLLSVSYENTATFVISNENILYINNEPFISFAPLPPECLKTVEDQEQKISSVKSADNIIEDLNIQNEISWNDLYTPDAKKEMAVVDEIIRNTAVELDQWESESSRSETSSDGMSGSDYSSKEKGEETDDPDWKPEVLPPRGRKRSKSYRRGGSQEEKKLRKKEQNKNAATRYRQKKKAELCEILREEESLKEKKAKLEEKVADIKSEIKCLKALMRDLFKAKGIIN